MMDDCRRASPASYLASRVSSSIHNSKQVAVLQATGRFLQIERFLHTHKSEHQCHTCTNGHKYTHRQTYVLVLVSS